MKYLLLIFLSLQCLANTRSNIEIVDSLLLSELDKSAKNLSKVLYDETELDLVDPYDFGIFRSNVLQSLVDNNIDFGGKEFSDFGNTDGINSNTRIELTKISVAYTSKDNRSVYRDIKISYFVQLVTANDDYYKKYDIEFQDEIQISDVSNAQSGPYQFLEAPLPKTKNSFLEKYTQPVIMIGSAVVALVLLFTIRSG